MCSILKREAWDHKLKTKEEKSTHSIPETALFVQTPHSRNPEYEEMKTG